MDRLELASARPSICLPREVRGQGSIRAHDFQTEKITAVPSAAFRDGAALLWREPGEKRAPAGPAAPCGSPLFAPPATSAVRDCLVPTADLPAPAESDCSMPLLPPRGHPKRAPETGLFPLGPARQPAGRALWRSTKIGCACGNSSTGRSCLQRKSDASAVTRVHGRTRAKVFPFLCRFSGLQG
jgi:hypothetical protein